MRWIAGSVFGSDSRPGLSGANVRRTIGFRPGFESKDQGIKHFHKHHFPVLVVQNSMTGHL